MGQRNQQAWNIPAANSFEPNRVIFRIPRVVVIRYGRLLFDGDLCELPVIDPTGDDPPLEEVIERVFAQEAPRGGPAKP